MSDMPMIGEEGFIGTTPKNAEKIEETLSIIKGTDENPEKELSPEETYEKGLKEVGITLAQSRVILESTFINEYYEEEVHLGAGVYAVFRSRQYLDTIRANRALERDRVELVSSVSDILNRYSTAAALMRYGQKDFNVPKPKDKADSQDIEKSFNERLDFLERLPTYVCNKLMQKSFDFDRKLLAVFADGAPADF